jgi:hypothetical protein
LSEERDAIQPEYEVALAHFASALRLRQERLPLWIAEALSAYGIACCKRGVALAHKKRTIKPRRGPWDDEETPFEIKFDDEETPTGER